MHYIIVLKKKEIYGRCKLYFNDLEKQINVKLNYIYCPKTNSNSWWMLFLKIKKHAASWKPWGMSDISKLWPETTSITFVLFLWHCSNGCEGHTDDACVGFFSVTDSEKAATLTISQEAFILQFCDFNLLKLLI